MFAQNSISMSESSRLHIVTGPNMAGKSTYLRQIALIAILAQIGSFVPADYAYMGLVDKVFTRIGARDDLYRNQSTFMVEMTETADILKNATEKSLVSYGCVHVYEIYLWTLFLHLCRSLWMKLAEERRSKTV